MSDLTPVAAARRAMRVWDVLRLALVLVWLLAAILAWWTSPREQTYAQARADVAAGRVTAYQWGDRWDDNSRRWFEGATLQSFSTLGPLIAWRTPDGRVHWTDTNDFGEVSTTGAVVDTSYSGAGAVGIAQDLRAAGLEGRAYDDVDPYGTALTWLSAILTVVFLGVVVAGPAPVVGTRWFWFWLVVIAPYGLGLLFWLPKERPWSRSPAPAVGFGDPERRKRGFLGLGLGLLVSFLVGVLLMILHSFLGDTWVPYVNA